jgi:transcriptional regulator with XRE-family HTH domain
MPYSKIDIMLASGSNSTTPIPVRRAVRKLGKDIRDARLRRRIPTAVLAQRASISRMTLYKVENGDTNVSMGTYATLLFALGMIDRIGNLADAEQDTLGRQLEEERLPKRVRLRRIAPRDAGAS